MAAKLSLFITGPQITHQTEQLLEKKFFDQMFCLESDKMTLTFNVNQNLDFLLKLLGGGFGAKIENTEHVL